MISTTEVVKNLVGSEKDSNNENQLLASNANNQSINLDFASVILLKTRENAQNFNIFLGISD